MQEESAALKSLSYLLENDESFHINLHKYTFVGCDIENRLTDKGAKGESVRKKPILIFLGLGYCNGLSSVRATRKKEIAGTTLAPSSAPGFPLYGSLLRRNPSLSVVRLQTPRLGHAQRYLNARFRSFGIFSAPQTRG